MATAYKRKRIKTGPHSWLNVTQHRNGTTTTSSSTSVAGRTTNISSKGVRRTVNDKGWVTTTRIPAFPKPKKTKKYRSKTPRYKKSSFSLFSLFSSGSKKKKKSSNDSAIAQSFNEYFEDFNRRENEKLLLEDEQRKEQLRVEKEKRLEEKRLREIEKAAKQKFQREFVGPPKPVTLDVKIIAYSIIAAFIYCVYKVFQFIFWLIYSI